MNEKETTPEKRQFRIDPKRGLVPLIGFPCPICQAQLTVVGLSEPVLWCDDCKIAFTICYKESNLTEGDLKDVWGFPENPKRKTKTKKKR